VHDLQASTKTKMDLLVMENLFHKQDVSTTYDLKGIGQSMAHNARAFRLAELYGVECG
jgi:hypothetical protein